MKHAHLKSRERPITTFTSFFLTLTKKPTCSHFSCKFLAMFGFQKGVLKTGGEGSVVPGLWNIWLLGCTEFASSQQGSKSLELTDVKPYVHNYFPYN